MGPKQLAAKGPFSPKIAVKIGENKKMFATISLCIYNHFWFSTVDTQYISLPPNIKCAIRNMSFHIHISRYHKMCFQSQLQKQQFAEWKHPWAVGNKRDFEAPFQWGLYATYHLLREPKTTIDPKLFPIFVYRLQIFWLHLSISHFSLVLTNSDFNSSAGWCPWLLQHLM